MLPTRARARTSARPGRCARAGTSASRRKKARNARNADVSPPHAPSTPRSSSTPSTTSNSSRQSRQRARVPAKKDTCRFARCSRGNTPVGHSQLRRKDRAQPNAKTRPVPRAVGRHRWQVLDRQNVGRKLTSSAGQEICTARRRIAPRIHLEGSARRIAAEAAHARRRARHWPAQPSARRAKTVAP